jgi:superfamily I DNA/RNA helicase
MERLIKDAFTTNTHFMKLATVQSFKGWEAQTVILIIMPERDQANGQFNVPELVYTGITRAKENLIVINVANDTYHNFFKTNIK